MAGWSPLALANRQARHVEELADALGAEPIERANLGERHAAQIERQLGERPENPADREGWERAAAAQESYALQYGQLPDPDITDTASLTGRQFDDFKQAIDLAEKFVNPPTPDLDRGPDLRP